MGTAKRGKRKGRGKPCPSSFSKAETALAVPAASEAATAVETPEAGGVGETYTTVEAARYAMAETATPEMGDTYAVETHAVMDDCLFGAYAVIEAAAFEVANPRPWSTLLILPAIAWLKPSSPRRAKPCDGDPRRTVALEP